MIDILIRAHNESIWLPQLFRSLEKQKGNIIRNILLLDNRSNDNPKKIIEQFPNLRIIYKKYEKEYLPGEMLNFGIKVLKNMISQESINSDYLCTLSAHCYFYKNNSLITLLNHIKRIPNCRSGYGRQVPMTISDEEAIRDLVLLYPKESRLITKAPAFNNAYSLIKYAALENNLFDNNTTNLEDMIWADKELKNGFQIAYCAESEVVHFHGPHHSNSLNRMQQTTKTIKKNSEIFNIKLRTANIIDSEIISIFAGNKLNKTLITEAKRQALKRKLIIWTEYNHEKDFSKQEFKNVIWIKRISEEFENKTIYKDLPKLYKKIENDFYFFNFYILYDNSVNENYLLINPDSSIEIISEHFGNVIWPSIKSNRIIFNFDKEGKPLSNKNFDESFLLKEKQIEVLRGNGTILSSAALLNPLLMFKDPKFKFID